jgi:hypothetical protein
MAYIRTKKINNHLYAYLVENVSTEKGPRQKVKQYLGRVYKFEKNSELKDIQEGNNKKEILLHLIIPELKAMGFKKKDQIFQLKNLSFDLEKFSLIKRTKSKTVKEAIIALNEGYLSSFTIQRILEFKKSKDVNKDAPKLGKYFLEAGLMIPPETFVKYYQAN